MIEIFLQDGIQAASERMNRGVWETSQMSPEEARRLADEMVRNAQAASDAAKQKALREKRRPA
ncbi:MAG: hypothetical protein SF069_03040 [Phycisphaerae bacterium]|nr:hypothetical protein [Phycisphaerae bacterium]